MKKHYFKLSFGDFRVLEVTKEQIVSIDFDSNSNAYIDCNGGFEGLCYDNELHPCTDSVGNDFLIEITKDFKIIEINNNHYGKNIDRVIAAYAGLIYVLKKNKNAYDLVTMV